MHDASTVENDRLVGEAKNERGLLLHDDCSGSGLLADPPECGKHFAHHDRRQAFERVTEMMVFSRRLASAAAPICQPWLKATAKARSSICRHSSA